MTNRAYAWLTRWEMHETNGGHLVLFIFSETDPTVPVFAIQKIEELTAAQVLLTLAAIDSDETMNLVKNLTPGMLYDLPADLYDTMIRNPSNCDIARSARTKGAVTRITYPNAMGVAGKRAFGYGRKVFLDEV